MFEGVGENIQPSLGEERNSTDRPPHVASSLDVFPWLESKAAGSDLRGTEVEMKLTNSLENHLKSPQPPFSKGGRRGDYWFYG